MKLLASVSVDVPSTASRRIPPDVPSNETVPLPPNVALPNELTCALEPIKWMVPFSVSPPLTRNPAAEPEIVRSLLSVTPLLNVPETLFAASNKAAPSANATVPPLIVPEKFHEPVVAFSVSVVPVLVSVPVRFTTPPARLKVPMPPVAFNVPPRFTVLAALASRWTVPPLVHEAGTTVRTPPPTASTVPALVKPLLGRIVKV